MKCSERACPFPERLDGLCAKHLRDRALESSEVGGSIPLMQEYALSDNGQGQRSRSRGNGLGPGGGARHIKTIEPWDAEL
jgi:hypothetical protein